MDRALDRKFLCIQVVYHVIIQKMHHVVHHILIYRFYQTIVTYMLHNQRVHTFNTAILNLRCVCVTVTTEPTVHASCIVAVS